jgi:hypothetical protein
MVLVRNALEDSVVDEAVQALGEDVTGDAEAGLEVIEASHAEQGIPDDEQAPPLPHDVEALSDRARHPLETGPLHI